MRKKWKKDKKTTTTKQYSLRRYTGPIFVTNLSPNHLLSWKYVWCFCFSNKIFYCMYHSIFVSLLTTLCVLLTNYMRKSMTIKLIISTQINLYYCIIPKDRSKIDINILWRNYWLCWENICKMEVNGLASCKQTSFRHKTGQFYWRKPLCSMSRLEFPSVLQNHTFQSDME